MKRGIFLVILSMGISFLISPTPAQEAQSDSPEVPASLKSLALFKNGLGFFAWEIQAPQNALSFRFKPLTIPTHGSCWVSGPAGTKIKSLTAVETQTSRTCEVVSVFELLKANVGKRVKINTGKEILEGKILRVPEDRLFDINDADNFRPRNAPRYEPGISNSQLVILQTANTEIGISSGQVQQVEFLDSPAATSYANHEKTVRFEIQLDQPAGGQTFIVSCLAKGATWAPSYQVDISKSDQARLSASAVIVNETTDLNNTDVQLITGYPNLKFADIISPLAKKQNLAEFLDDLASGRSRQDRFANSPMSQQALHSYSWNRGAMDSAGGTAIPAELAYGTATAGMEAEDLFLYPLEKVSLKKNQIGFYPLFTETVPYKHIYQWDIPDYVNEDDQYQSNRRQDNTPEQKPEIIWHSLKLENKTSVPWTTAPAQTVRDGMILGQGIINYTAVGAETTLKITQAVNVKAEQAEQEIVRKRDALHMYGYNYDLVTLEGKLSVLNLQDKPIDMEIAKTLSGEIKNAEKEPKIEKPGKGLHRMNGLAKLTWTKTLPAREKIEITYTYDVYVRR
jgi:hypothetical protein